MVSNILFIRLTKRLDHWSERDETSEVQKFILVKFHSSVKSIWRRGRGWRRWWSRRRRGWPRNWTSKLKSIRLGHNLLRIKDVTDSLHRRDKLQALWLVKNGHVTCNIQGGFCKIRVVILLENLLWHPLYRFGTKRLNFDHFQWLFSVVWYFLTKLNLIKDLKHLMT